LVLLVIHDPYLNDGSGRYKSDVLEGLMAAALDNGKEQILGKLGIADSTFDFIRAMVATGFNEEGYYGDASSAHSEDLSRVRYK
jgi:hypothetical protein